MAILSNDGMWNPKTGKWNPSRDDFRYDSSNSATGMDFALSGMGLRRWGLGGKVPFIFRAGNKGAELGYKGAKGIYAGQKRIRAWKKTVDQKISKTLKEEPYTAKKPMDKLRQRSKTVGRILNSKKGRALTTAVLSMSALGAGTQKNPSSEDTTWIPVQKKKRRTPSRWL